MKYFFRLSCSGLVLFVAVFQAAGQQDAASSLLTSYEGFVNVGNHKLFVIVNGNKTSKFTVVFESGAGGSSQDWEKVVARLPQNIRTVTYDRASVGKSEAGPLPQTMAQSVFELHRLLLALKIDGPIILVGQSLGGLLARLYTERYGERVAGLVLVDPTHESNMLGSMRYGGWVRLREKASGKPIPTPQVKNRISPGYDSTADYMAEEFQHMYLLRRKQPQPLGNRPLVILGAGIRKQPPGTPDQQWKEISNERDNLLQDLTSLSGNSKFILAPESGHFIHHDNPEIVVKAIQMIMESIVSKSKL